MKQVRAGAPGNISLIFKVVEHSDPRWKGSLGVGFTIDQGVTVTAQKSETFIILLNGETVSIEPVERVWKVLNIRPVSLQIETKLPLGCGFGVSGASTLATVNALNKLFELGKNNLDLAIFAHTA